MAKKIGIQLRGSGRALRPSGPGVIRPKPQDRYGQPFKPKPIRPGKKDGGMMDRDKQPRQPAPKKDGLKKPTPDQKGLQKLPEKVRNKMGYMKKGGRVKKFPDLSGDGKVTKKDILMGRGVIKRKK